MVLFILIAEYGGQVDFCPTTATNIFVAGRSRNQLGEMTYKEFDRTSTSNPA
jgi:hypothetical protein